MGCCLFLRSSRSSSSSSSASASASTSLSSSSAIIDSIRVVDLNGYVVEFDYPVPVGQVTGRSSKHFLFTAAQLLSAGSLKPLKPDVLLEPGKIYFSLPVSAIQGEVSPLDLASTVKRLTASAKSKPSITIKSPANFPGGNTPSVCPEWNPTIRSPQPPAMGSVECLSPKLTWTPILDPIKEMSYMRSESEAKEIGTGEDGY